MALIVCEIVFPYEGMCLAVVQDVTFMSAVLAAKHHWIFRVESPTETYVLKVFFLLAMDSDSF